MVLHSEVDSTGVLHAAVEALPWQQAWRGTRRCCAHKGLATSSAVYANTPAPLQAHGFFRQISWHDLEERKMEPPFKVGVVSLI